MEPVTYHPIGFVRSPFRRPRGTPIQPPAAAGVSGTIEVDPAYADGLKDLEGFSHLILLYHFHLSKPAALQVRPFMDDEPHGVFAMRGPSRPNSIGLSVVRLLAVEGTTLEIQDVDVVYGTPLLDIKPYVPEFDSRGPEGVRIGWLGPNIQKLRTQRDDGRFVE